MEETYWKDAAATLIQGLVLYVLQGPAERRNPDEVRRLIAEGDVAGYAEVPDELKDKVTPFDVFLEKMKRVPEGYRRDQIVNPATSMLMMGENQRAGVLMTAREESELVEEIWVRYAGKP